VRLSRSKFSLQTRTTSIEVDEPVALLVEAYAGLRRVVSPLGIRGMEKLEIVDEDVGLLAAEILASDVPESDYLPPLESIESEIEESETLVQVVGPDLVGGVGGFAWRLTEGVGRHSFTAQLMDAEFAGRMSRREVLFGNGDRLRVRLRKRKTVAGGRLHTEIEIVKVLAHYAPGTQGTLL
ncbi:MAG: hypothetical protein ACRDKE_00580, partial [Solirubrobacterales bacterium]